MCFHNVEMKKKRLILVKRMPMGVKRKSSCSKVNDKTFKKLQNSKTAARLWKVLGTDKNAVAPISLHICSLELCSHPPNSNLKQLQNLGLIVIDLQTKTMH